MTKSLHHRFAAAYGQLNSIHQLAPVCTPHNTCFLGPVLDVDPAPPTERGTAAPHFRNLRMEGPYKLRPIFIVPNGWMDQDATWYGGRP